MRRVVRISRKNAPIVCKALRSRCCTYTATKKILDVAAHLYRAIRAARNPDENPDSFRQITQLASHSLDKIFLLYV